MNRPSRTTSARRLGEAGRVHLVSSGFHHVRYRKKAPQNQDTSAIQSFNSLHSELTSSKSFFRANKISTVTAYKSGAFHSLSPSCSAPQSGACQHRTLEAVEVEALEQRYNMAAREVEQLAEQIFSHSAPAAMGETSPSGPGGTSSRSRGVRPGVWKLRTWCHHNSLPTDSLSEGSAVPVRPVEDEGGRTSAGKPSENTGVARCCSTGGHRYSSLTWTQPGNILLKMGPQSYLLDVQITSHFLGWSVQDLHFPLPQKSQRCNTCQVLPAHIGVVEKGVESKGRHIWIFRPCQHVCLLTWLIHDVQWNQKAKHVALEASI